MSMKKKDEAELHFSQVYLGSSLYINLQNKNKQQIDVLQKEIADNEEEIKRHQLILDVLTIGTEQDKLIKLAQEKYPNLDREDPINFLIEKFKEEGQALEVAIRKTREKLSHSTQTRERLDKLKEGSVANVNQITTISKMRIVDPTKQGDSLYEITLSFSELEKIDTKIKQLYLT